LGVFSLMALATSRFSSTPHSWAMAGRCSMLLVEQPRAMSTVRAFISASLVMIWRAVTPLRTMSITAMPARLASSMRAE